MPDFIVFHPALSLASSSLGMEGFDRVNQNQFHLLLLDLALLDPRREYLF
jgi:hypothetical protein